MLTIILIEPEHPGNIGAIVRVMANFELLDLVLVNPKCDPLSEEARNRAKNAQELLRNAVVINITKKISLKSFLKKFDYVIGSTAQLGTDYNMLRSPITPEQLAKTISPKINDQKINIALLFGREGIGLRNSELQLADFIVHIPTSKKYHAMNVSQAATIIFYEIFKHTSTKHTSSHINPATAKDKEIVLWRISQVLDNMKFATKEKKRTQELVWKRVLNKAMLTKREAFAMLGFFRKLIISN